MITKKDLFSISIHHTSSYGRWELVNQETGNKAILTGHNGQSAYSAYNAIFSDNEVDEEGEELLEMYIDQTKN